MIVLEIIKILIGTILVVGALVSIPWSIVLLFKDEPPGRAVFIWLLTPIAVVVLSLIDSTREYGARKTWLGFTKKEFDELLAAKRS